MRRDAVRHPVTQSIRIDIVKLDLPPPPETTSANDDTPMMVGGGGPRHDLIPDLLRGQAALAHAKRRLDRRAVWF